MPTRWAGSAVKPVADAVPTLFANTPDNSSAGSLQHDIDSTLRREDGVERFQLRGVRLGQSRHTHPAEVLLRRQYIQFAVAIEVQRAVGGRLVVGFGEQQVEGDP